ncbi:MAG: hypothetical protein ACK4M7_10260, partial [Burkholderiales bacterium]
ELIPDMLAGSPSAAVSKNTMQLSFKQRINPSFSYSIGIEESTKWDLYPGIKDEEKDKKGEQPNNGLPHVAGNLVYDLPGKLGIIKLTGVVSFLSYYSENKNDTFGATAFGANIGTKLNLNANKTTFIISAVYGKGVGDYISDLSLLEKEQKTAYRQTTDGKVTTLDAWGSYIALQHKWDPKVRSVFTSGFLTTLANGGTRTLDEYKYGYHGSANVTYHPTDQFYFGLEYLYGGRTNLDNKVNKDTVSHCFEAVAGFNF